MKDTREYILNIALKLFLQKSFKAVTLKEIVETSQLSKGAFYHYFKSKEEVFVEVIKHFYGDMIAMQFDTFSQTSLKQYYLDFLGDIQRRIGNSALSKATGEHFNVNHYMLLFEASKLIPGFLDVHREHNEKELRYWTEAVLRAQKSGEIKSQIPAEQIAKMFFYMADGYGMNKIWHGPSIQNDELQQLWDGLYEMLRK